MKLSELIAGAKIIRRDAEDSLDITNLAIDSRRIEPGGLFAAVPGFKLDGHEFVPQALEAGASVILTERWLDEAGIPQLQTDSVRRTIALAAANFFGHPSRDLELVGVTGTNGKTTTTFLLDSILRAAGRKTGLIGGIEYRVVDEATPAARTTPEAIDLQRLLSQMVDAGADAATIEVSSHGIDLYRVAYLKFAVAVLTNVTRDHLDLHQSMESYYQTKRRLFTCALADKDTSCSQSNTQPPIAVINADDEYGQRLLEELSRNPQRKIVPFGLGSSAEVRAAVLDSTGWQTSIKMTTPAGSEQVMLNLAGEFNIYNALAAAAAATALEIPLDSIVSGLSSSHGAPGRFERVDVDQAFKVVVDYAHNEDGLAKAISTARSLTPGRVIVVFGCPGERDREKRPGMGRIAGELADLAILTTDDCYAEPPAQILAETEPGLVESGGEFKRIADRREAIDAALSAARPEDTVLIAGKGHETRQIMADGAIDFNDRATVLDLLAGR